jgi:hypothetical protein
MGQPVGLRGKITGDASIEPTLDLGGQIKNFDGHGGIPLRFRRLEPVRAANLRDTQLVASNGI